MGDLAVDVKGDSLSGKKILLGICGGIAATQSVKLLRELRRYQAEITVMMTDSAQKIITPLAISWAGDCEVITKWEHQMTGLQKYDAILITPATRNMMAKITNGILDSPLMMALSAAKSNSTPVMIVPSMHNDLAKDPKTIKLNEMILDMGFEIFNGHFEENKLKQPSEISIVANFSHQVNKQLPSRKKVVITLGSTITYLDNIRYVKNTSTGKTGFEIGSKLHRWGHEVTIVSGEVNYSPDFKLPVIINANNPDEMLKELMALSKCSIDVWIHSAAVLDYVNKNIINGKIPSGDDSISFNLTKSSKHLQELKNVVKGSFRIGFKLESDISLKELIMKGTSFVKYNELDAIIANRLEDLNDNSKDRAHLILKNGEHFKLSTIDDLSNSIRLLIENN